MEKPSEVLGTQPQIGVAVEAPSYFSQQPVRPLLPDEAEVSEDKAKPPPKGFCRWLGRTHWNRKGTQPRSQTKTASTSTRSLPDTPIDSISSKGAAGALDRFKMHSGQIVLPSL